MSVGTEWLVDAEGCAAELVRDSDLLRSVCEEVIEALGLHLIGKAKWHRFPEPGGVTGLYLLTESHLTCHTFPEIGLATFNLYCCRPRPPFAWETRLRALLGAVRVTVRSIDRGNLSIEPDLIGQEDVSPFERRISEVTSTREVSGL